MNISDKIPTPKYLSLAAVLAFGMMVFSSGCKKNDIEEQCQNAANQKCGTGRSVGATICRAATKKVCITKLCNLPFNDCSDPPPETDDVCSAGTPCTDEDPPGTTYPDPNS